MDVRRHPEYDLYHRDAALVATCRRAMAAWKEDGEAILAPDGVTWTPHSARAFVEEVAELFQAYNLALWQTFSYCRSCRGGCCVTGASQVTTFDALALALLDEPFPHLAPRAAEGDCIYLGAQGCSWPQAWRPIKCWAFYCLGSGDWEIDAEDARYERITQRLQTIVQQRLPGYLQRRDVDSDAPLHQFLADPIAFAGALGAALYEIFVAPFASAYNLATDEQPLAAGESEILRRDELPATEQALAFIAGAVEELWQRPASAATATDDQLLEDLERLEWVLVQRPPHAQPTLQALSDCYAADNERAKDGGAGPLREQMAVILQKLLRDPAPPAHSR